MSPDQPAPRRHAIFGASPADRTQTVERLFQAVEADGVQSLILRDATGNSRGVASSVGGRRTVRVE